jgi:hypothetical protein
MKATTKALQLKVGMRTSGLAPASMPAVPAGVAQLAEQPSCKRQVSGSNPLTGSQVKRHMAVSQHLGVDRFVDRMTVVHVILLACPGFAKCCLDNFFRRSPVTTLGSGHGSLLAVRVERFAG